MRTTFYSLGLALLFSTVVFPAAQTPKRFDSGPLKGFTESPTEHLLDQIPEPLKVRSVRGVVQYLHGEPVDEVVVEIRDREGNVRGARTNDRGQFQIHNVAVGTYDFKLTKNGFQSIVGTIEVSKTAPRKNRIALTMKLGM